MKKTDFFWYILGIIFVLQCQGLTILNPAGPVNYRCLDCICDTVSGCVDDQVCLDDDACGRFRIKPQYWLDAGRPTLEDEDPNTADAYINCVTNKRCAGRTVQRYMERNKKDCNGDGAIDCKDFYAIHLHGAAACNRTLHDNFVKRFDKCDQPLKIVPANKRNQIFLPNFDDTCAKCLCAAASGCIKITECDDGFCGLYRLSREYWLDAGAPVVVGDEPERLDAFEECAFNDDCALRTIKQYIQNYGKDCNGDRVTSCHDYMMIQFNGGFKCDKPVELDPWGKGWVQRFNTCMSKARRELNFDYI